MIVNPPRSEVELSPRLQAISVHAAEKNDDPDDRPPLLPPRLALRALILVSILLMAGTVRLGLWYFTEHPASLTAHAETAEMYRRLARDVEAEAKVLRSVAKSGQPVYVARFGRVTDPVQADGMASQAELLGVTYRRQAYVEECLNLGVPIR